MRTTVHRLLRLAGASLIFRPQASNIKWTCVEIGRAVKMKMIPTSCVEKILSKFFRGQNKFSNINILHMLPTIDMFVPPSVSHNHS